MLSAALLASYAATVATIVSALISSLIKPLIESIPAFSPSAPDQRPHDAALRGVNIALNVIGVAILAAAQGYLTLGNWQTLAMQIVFQVAWSHGVYQTVKPAVAGAAAPYHMQAAPPSPAPVSVSPASPAPVPSEADAAAAI